MTRNILAWAFWLSGGSVASVAVAGLSKDPFMGLLMASVILVASAFATLNWRDDSGDQDPEKKGPET